MILAYASGLLIPCLCLQNKSVQHQDSPELCWEWLVVSFIRRKGHSTGIAKSPPSAGGLPWSGFISWTPYWPLRLSAAEKLMSIKKKQNTAQRGQNEPADFPSILMLILERRQVSLTTCIYHATKIFWQKEKTRKSCLTVDFVC